MFLSCIYICEFRYTLGTNMWFVVQGGSNMTGTNCDLFTHKSVPVIFEPPCIIPGSRTSESLLFYIPSLILRRLSSGWQTFSVHGSFFTPEKSQRILKFTPPGLALRYAQEMSQSMVQI
jgi:hypothetical protein